MSAIHTSAPDFPSPRRGGLARLGRLWSWLFRLSRRDRLFLSLLTLVAVTGGSLSLMWASYADSMLIREIARNAAIQWADHLVAHVDMRKLVQGKVSKRRMAASLNFGGSIGDVYRYTLFNADGRVITATRRSEIGRQLRPPMTVEGGLPRIEVRTFLGNKEGVIRDHARTFIPFIYGGKPIGAVEVHIDLTHHVETHRRGFRVMIMGVVAALAITSLLAGFIIVRNMMERESNLRRLRRARDEANRANRTKSEFLANMSHELRTPLNAILGFSDILDKQAFGPLGNDKYQGYARDINDSGQHLLSLINDILDLAKIESGRGEIDPEPVDITELVDQVTVLVRERARAGEVALHFDNGCEGREIRVDQRKMKQVLINLMSNAIKFTEPGGEVTLRTREQPGKCMCFEIADTGIGMEPDDIPRALASFQQVDSDLGRRYEGTGLGLPLAKALVEMHGGVLVLDSAPGRGTTVTVRLPHTLLVRGRAIA